MSSKDFSTYPVALLFSLPTCLETHFYSDEGRQGDSDVASITSRGKIRCEPRCAASVPAMPALKCIKSIRSILMKTCLPFMPNISQCWLA